MTSLSRHLALDGLFDDAGLFPPATLGMADAIERHIADKRGNIGWLVGPFVCPLSRLEEFREQAGRHPGFASELSLLARLDGGEHHAVATALAGAAGGLSRDSWRAVAVELSLADGTWTEVGFSDELAELCAGLAGSGVEEVYVEVPIGAGEVTRAAVDTLVRARERGVTALAAKFRCGGLRVDDFPSLEGLAAVLGRCSLERLPFKCTAGLHQALRHVDTTSGWIRHGFVNVLVASCLGLSGSPERVRAALADGNPADFGLDQDSLRWLDWQADSKLLAVARETGFRSFGSCSIEEPVEALRQLGADCAELPPAQRDSVSG